MKRRKNNSLWDLLDELPGRPWWWLSGTGVVLAVIVFFIFRGIFGGVSAAANAGPIANRNRVLNAEGNYDDPKETARNEWAAKQKAKEANEAKKNSAAKPAAPVARVAAPDADAANRAGQAMKTAVLVVSPPPLDLSQWNESDFLRARAMGDARLTAALDHRVKAARGTTAEAEMLAALLRPQWSLKPATAVVGVAGSNNAAATPAALIPAVTAALGANNTEPARETLTQLLSGEFPLAPRQAGVDGALAALLEQGSPESEQIVLHHLIAPPTTVQPESGTTIPTDAAATAELVAVRGHASARFRKLLARVLIEGAVPAVAQRNGLLSLLREANPLNLEAQVLIYQSELADSATRAALEKQFLETSSEVLRTFLGFTPRQAAPPPRPDWQYRVGEQLWGPPLTDFLALEHQALATLGDGPAMVALGATIPNDAVRSKLRRTLSRHWSEGPQAIRGAGVPASILVEPGLVVALKAVARENAHGKATMKAPHAHTPRTRPTAGNSNAGAQPNAAAQSETAWDKLIEELVQGYCRCCHKAAMGRIAYRNGSAPASDDIPADLPLAPHPGSMVNAAYHIDWPGKYVANLAQLADDSLQVNYLRIEERTKPSRPLNYYRRQLKHCIEHPLPDGLWLDSLTEAAGEDRTRSIDVLITRSSAGALVAGDEEQELTIQILSIEVRKLRD